MIYTDTDICNNALALIGEAPIQSIDGTGEKERRCNALYDVTSREVQNGFVWQELITEIGLLPVPSEEMNTNRRFDLPPNCLRVTDVQTLDLNSNYKFNIDYYLEKNQIVCDATQILVTYLKYSEMPSEWSVELSQCIYYSLAIKLAPMITDNSGLGNNIMQQYKQIIEPEARRLQSINKDRITDKKAVVRGSWNRTLRNRRGW